MSDFIVVLGSDGGVDEGIDQLGYLRLIVSMVVRLWLLTHGQLRPVFMHPMLLRARQYKADRLHCSRRGG